MCHAGFVGWRVLLNAPSFAHVQALDKIDTVTAKIQDKADTVLTTTRVSVERDWLTRWALRRPISVEVCSQSAGGNAVGDDHELGGNALLVCTWRFTTNVLFPFFFTRDFSANAGVQVCLCRNLSCFSDWINPTRMFNSIVAADGESSMNEPVATVDSVCQELSRTLDDVDFALRSTVQSWAFDHGNCTGGEESGNVAQRAYHCSSWSPIAPWVPTARCHRWNTVTLKLPLYVTYWAATLRDSLSRSVRWDPSQLEDVRATVTQRSDRIDKATGNVVDLSALLFTWCPRHPRQNLCRMLVSMLWLYSFILQSYSRFQSCSVAFSRSLVL